MQTTEARVVRFLVDHARCTDCGGQYHLDDVYILANREDRVWDLAAVCHDCHTLSLIRAIVRTPVGRERVPAPVLVAVTELTPAEQSHFGDLTPVDSDDVLDVAAFLSDFDGDFRGLFGREPDDM
jgi:hypothetical protein